MEEPRELGLQMDAEHSIIEKLAEMQRRAETIAVLAQACVATTQGGRELLACIAQLRNDLFILETLFA